jgi:hypothetical protein
MRRIILSMAVGALLAGTMFADEKIHDRKENQQDRIANGVQSGSLTAGETSHVEHQESNLNKEIRTDRRANGGNLTNNEKRQVNHQQYHLSKEIYRDKHNGRKQ